MFYLPWKENLAKHQRVSKYYESDCVQNFILLFMALWTAQIVKGALLALRNFLTTESRLKMMKNAFYFTSKALLVLKMYRNSLIKKIRLISNFMTSQPGWQTIVIHILPNISRTKDNQTMKFGHLIKCNKKNISLKKSYTKCGEETSFRCFS